MLGLLLATLSGCGGVAAVGEACDVEGQLDQCEDGAICGKSATAIQCLKVCTSSTDCAADFECNGVSGSNVKGCRLKDTIKK